MEEGVWSETGRLGLRYQGRKGRGGVEMEEVGVGALWEKGKRR